MKAQFEELLKEYFQILENSEVENERYKRELIEREQANWKSYESGQIDFKTWIDQIDWSNLVYMLFIPNFKFLVNQRPEEVEKAIHFFFDEEQPLQDRIIATYDRLNELYIEIRSKEKDNLFFSEREMATLLTYRYPEKYTFYLNKVYSKFIKRLGRKQPAKLYRLTDYYTLLDELLKIQSPLFEKAVEQKRSKLHEVSPELEPIRRLVLQDVLHVTLSGTYKLNTDVPDVLEEGSEDMNYWMYAPGPKAELWEEFYEKGIMGIEWEALGDLRKYQTKESIAEKLRELEKTNSSKKNDATATWEFTHVLKPGDIVICKKGRREYVGWGVVTSEYYWDESASSFKNRRRVNWKAKGSWVDSKGDIVTKTLTLITHYPEYVDRLNRLLNITGDSNGGSTSIRDAQNLILFGPPGTGKTYKLKEEYFPQYTAKQTSITAEKHFEHTARNLSWWQAIALALMETGDSKVADIKKNRWVQHKIDSSESKNPNATLWGTLQHHTVEESTSVNYKRRMPPLLFDKLEDSRWTILENEIEQQAPELLEIKQSVDDFKPDPEKLIRRYVFTTFHQSFSYEDFIEGIKPVLEAGEQGEVTYEIEPGIFKRLCEEAIADPDHRYAIFIDEVNRGNIAQIFGELITLIETDKRKGMVNELSSRLPYSKKDFIVPANVDIIATMNTADRSVEALDTALRRRFSFVEMPPRYDLPQLEREIAGVRLNMLLKVINDRIERLLDKDHLIGHSYFINVEDEADLVRAFNDNIVPLLQEYFYNDFAKIGMVLGKGFVMRKIEVIDFADFEDGLNADYENREVFTINVINSQNLKSALELLMNKKVADQENG